jgi:hypothetical protein
VDTSVIQAWFDFLKKLWPEITGGWIAYWMHHFAHKLYGFHILKFFKRKKEVG